MSEVKEVVDETSVSNSSSINSKLRPENDLVNQGTNSENSSKRPLSTNSDESPPHSHPHQDVTNSNSKRMTSQHLSNFIKPIYPSQPDRKGIEDASEHGTRVKIIGVSLPDERTSPYNKVMDKELWEQLVAQKAEIASVIEKISSENLCCIPGKSGSLDGSN